MPPKPKLFDIIEFRVISFSTFFTIGNFLASSSISFMLIEADINLRAANKKLVEEFRKIAPFGSENSEPIIAISKIRIKNFRLVGKEGKHFSFIASDEIGDTLNCIAFNVAGSPLGDAIKIASNGPLMHLIGYLRENSFNSQPQLTVIDCYLIN